MNPETMRVLVARPQPQANVLAQHIHQQGWQALLMPSIEIQPLSFDLSKPLADYHALIFISQNAVEQFIAGLDITQLVQKPVFAIGPGTAQLLLQYGMQQVMTQDGIANSENLLRHKALQTEVIQAQSVLLVAGQGGRDLLEQTLQQRGAEVERLAVYARAIPCYDQSYIDKCWQSIPDVMVLSSIEVADKLITILQPYGYLSQVLSTPSIVMSERIRDHLLERGFNKQIIVVDDTSNDGIMASLERFAKEVLYE